MNTGICYLIHNKEDYPSNKKKIIKAIEKQNEELDYIFDASVVEFRNDLYLIIDGHSSILDEEKFVGKLSKLICPAYKEDAKGLKSLEVFIDFYFMIDEIEEMKDRLDTELLQKYKEMKEMMDRMNFSLEKVKREHLYAGQMYGMESPLLYKLFGIEEEKELLEQLSEDIFKATTEKVSVGEVRFVETLYQLDI